MALPAFGIAMHVTALGALAQPQVSVGVKGGLAVTTVGIESSEAEDGITSDSTAGLTAGLFLGRGLGDSLGFQVEALWSRKGAGLDFFGTPVDIDLDYLEFPILLTYTAGAGNGLRPRVVAGPAVGLLLGDTQKVDGDTLEGDDKVEFSRGDIGLAIGAGVEGPRWVFDVRSTHGLRNFHDDDPDLTAIETIRNRAFTITAGWKIP
jgi:hypothetical protein